MRRGYRWSGLSFWSFRRVLEIPSKVVIHITPKSVDHRNMLLFQLAYIFALLVCENLCPRTRQNSQRLGAELSPLLKRLELTTSLPTC